MCSQGQKKGGTPVPWRKYKTRKGKYGPIYPIDKGISVRQDARGKWTLFIEKGDFRRCVTYDSGRAALTLAIKKAESVARELKTFDFSLLKSEPKTVAPRFNVFSERWLDNNQQRWDLYTQQRYAAIRRLHLAKAAWFAKPVDEISRKEIRFFLQKLTKRRAARTVETIHAVISGIFEEAIEDELIQGNPATGLLKRILPPKKKRDAKDPEPFTVKERKRFENWAGQNCTFGELMLLRVMSHAGLRLGEALAFRLANLDEAKMEYHVTQSFRQKRFKKPKGEKMRYVDLPAYLVDELRVYIRQLRLEKLKQGRGAEVDYLFEDPDTNGKWPLSQRKAQRLVERVCKGAKLSRRNPHDLRHTYATIMLMAHQSPAYVKQQLGHSSISITVDRYCHWIRGEGRDGLEQALEGGLRVRNRDEKPHIFPYTNKGSQ
jgi:integrase